MADKSQIEWTDATWNPVTGCTKVSPGCAHCYIDRTPAFRINHRHFVHGTTGVRLHPDRLDQPLHWRRPRMIFVNSLSDLFHEDVPDDFIRQVFDVMRWSPQHIFQVLTKRPERVRPVLEHFYMDLDDPPPNIWLGVTIENRRFVHRADLLRQTPAAVRFISAEPLLGPLIADGDWRPDPTPDARFPAWEDGYEGPELNLYGIDWLIAGGESGPNFRRLDLAWVRDLRDACAAAGTAFFMKQLGGYRPGNKLDALPEDLQIRQMPRPALESTR